MRTTVLSALQYPALKLFAEGAVYVSIAKAQEIDQRPFRSLLIRGYVEYRSGKGFHITEKGISAWEEFRHRSIARKNPALPLTAYFDPAAYGLSPKRKAKAKAAA